MKVEYTYCRKCGKGNNKEHSNCFNCEAPLLPMNGDEFKELNNATYIALLKLKIAKMDMKSTFALKGRFLSGHPYPIPYTERELRSKKLLAEGEYNERLLMFKALWKARRRAQAT